MRGCQHITITDAVSFYYQWQVAEEDRYIFTMDSHRGQEQLNVGIMGYRNTVQYVLRQLDGIHRPMRDFACGWRSDRVDVQL